MNRIHRHIFANVVLTCGAAVGMFAFVLMLGSTLKDLLGHILAGQLAPGIVLRLVGLTIPVVVSYALPMGMLSGILLVLGRMSSDREVTALRASGLSVAWLSAPILFFGLLGTVLSVLVNFEFMPRAKVAYERELAQAVQQNPLSFITPRTFIRDFPGLVIYAGEKNGNQLRDFWLWELDAQGRVKHFARAEAGRVEFDSPNNRLVLTLFNARGEPRNAKDPENYGVLQGASAAQQATFDLPLGRLTGAATVNVKQRWLTFSQLIAKWRELHRPDPKLTEEERAQQLMRVQITIHEKFATAFSVLSFALIAVPLGIKISRKETSANLGIGLGLAMAYYFGTIVVSWFDNVTALRPDLLMWGPNIGFQALGFWMFHKVDRAKT
ncbi:MAG TPA: LptF/LptG family permease [Lacunisphaera sp.]|nr:LptF/LptG family permease [Lacunisphaera sp.]